MGKQIEKQKQISVLKFPIERQFINIGIHNW